MFYLERYFSPHLIIILCRWKYCSRGEYFSKAGYQDLDGTITFRQNKWKFCAIYVVMYFWFYGFKSLGLLYMFKGGSILCKRK